MVLIVTAVYFLLPLWAALRFAGIGAFGSVVSEAGFTSSLALSVRLAVITTVLTIALILPTAVYVHLRLPKLRRLLEGITILPIVIPPVVLIVGVLAIAPGVLKGTSLLLSLVYVVLAMPFAYRAIDAGLRALDLKTIVEASNSLGAGWRSTLWRVILPNLRTALLSATVLTVALVLGEFTIASLDLYQTFPVWIYVNSQTSGQVSVAASLLALFVTWVFLLAITVLGSQAVAQDRWRRGHLVHRRTYRNAGRLMTANTAGNAATAADTIGQAERRGGTSVLLRDLTRAFGATRALDGLSIEMAPGELVALLGPSGCGKTTALRIVAGFETADTGSVLVDGKDISSVPAARRDMGMVFQSYSLFPNMSALDNVAFGLRMRKIGAGERRKRAGDLLDMVGLAPRPASTRTSCPAVSSSGSRWPGRWPSSPGCCCSTSRCPRWTPRSGCSCASRSARCSSGSAPPPCSSPTTRRKPCPWRTGSASCSNGKLEQIAAPDELYTDPATAFVAEFVGVMNRIPGELQPGGQVTALGSTVPVRGHSAGPDRGGRAGPPGGAAAGGRGERQRDRDDQDVPRLGDQGRRSVVRRRRRPGRPAERRGGRARPGRVGRGVAARPARAGRRPPGQLTM